MQGRAYIWIVPQRLCTREVPEADSCEINGASYRWIPYSDPVDEDLCVLLRKALYTNPETAHVLASTPIDIVIENHGIWKSFVVKGNRLCVQNPIGK